MITSFLFAVAVTQIVRFSPSEDQNMQIPGAGVLRTLDYLVANYLID